jgi:hypothetical protein
MPKLSSICCLVAVFAATSSAQSAQKVIDEYLRARGGAKAFSQIQTETISGNLTEDGSGRTGSFAMIAKAPNRTYLELVAGSDRMVESYNGMSAWTQDAAGVHTITGAGAREAEGAGRFRNNRLTNLKKGKLLAQLAGSEKIRGKDAVHVLVVEGPGLTRDLYFDPATHLLMRETAAGEQFDYDDYRSVDGIRTPYRIDLRRGAHTYHLSVTQADFHTAAKDSVFDFPSASAAPVPDMKALIQEVSRNQNALEEMQKQYTCHLTTEEEAIDSKGKSQGKKVKEFEVFNIAGEEVRHQLSEDNKPFEGDKKKKEDERFNKEYAKLLAQEQKKDPKKQAKEKEKEDTALSDILRAVRFSNARRERFRGQEVIAIDFGPNPDYKPRNMRESIVQKLAGVVWIDEQARDVARLEAHFSTGVKVGAGILGSIEQGTSFVFEQAKVNDEVWLPVYAEVHAAARLLFIRARANETDRYTDYKKFRAESTIKIVE